MKKKRGEKHDKWEMKGMVVGLPLTP